MTETGIDWEGLAAFCAGTYVERPGRDKLTIPSLYDVRGVLRTVVTNGNLLVLGPPIDGAPTLADDVKLTRICRDERPTVGYLSLVALRSTLGLPAEGRCPTCAVMPPTPCAECTGNGEIKCFCHCGDEHYIECKACRGYGKQDCRECAVQHGERASLGWGDQILGRGLLRRAAQYLPPVEVRVSTRGHPHAVYFDADTFRAALMPLRNRQMSHTDIAHLFTPEPAAASTGETAVEVSRG